MSEIEYGLGDWFVARNGEVGVVMYARENPNYPNLTAYESGRREALTTKGRAYIDGGTSDWDAVRKIPGPDHMPFDLDKWPTAPIDSGWRGPGLYRLGDGDLAVLDGDDEMFIKRLFLKTGVSSKFILSWDQLQERAAKA